VYHLDITTSVTIFKSFSHLSYINFADLPGEFTPKSWHSSSQCTTSVNKAFLFQQHSFSSKIERNPSYSFLNSDDISYFKSVLEEKCVVQDEERLSVANTDWLSKYKGASQLLLLPKDTNEVLSKFACITQSFTVSTDILHAQHFLSFK
jgi:hypothetical protein